MAYTSEVFLVSSRTDTASATKSTGSTSACDLYKRGTALLHVDSSSSGSGSFTLDCAIQSTFNGVWTDIARFPQITSISDNVLWDIGDGQTNTSSTISEVIQSLNITTASKRAGPWGVNLRAIWTIVITGTYSLVWSLTIDMQA